MPRTFHVARNNPFLARLHTRFMGRDLLSLAPDLRPLSPFSADNVLTKCFSLSAIANYLIKCCPTAPKFAGTVVPVYSVLRS